MPQRHVRATGGRPNGLGHILLHALFMRVVILVIGTHHRLILGSQCIPLDPRGLALDTQGLILCTQRICLNAEGLILGEQ